MVLFQVVIFCFSKNRCDKSADSMFGSDLTSNSEKSEIRVFCDKAFSRLKGCSTPLLRVVQPAAERRRRVVQPDGCGDGSGPHQAEGNACCLLGRGGGDGRLHPQPLAHQGSQRQYVVQGLAWAQADGLSPTGLRLPRIRQGA
jgi:hypothetical protein